MLNTELFVGFLGGIVGQDVNKIILVSIFAAIGRMCGKTILYLAVQRGMKFGFRKERKLNMKLKKWHDRIEKLPHSKTHTLTLTASAIGFPPMYLLTIVLGALKIPWWPHFWIGLVGSTLKYGAFFVFGAEISKKFF